MTDIPILGGAAPSRVRTPEQKASDTKLARWLGEMALKADAGLVDAIAIAACVHGEKLTRTLVHDDWDKRGELVFQLGFLQHALLSTEYNWRMASLAGGQPAAAAAQIEVAR